MPDKEKNQGSVSQITTTALAGLTAATGIIASGPAMTRGGTIISGTITATIFSVTAGDGPILLILADKDLSLSEVEEQIELNGPVSPSDIVGNETSSRGRNIRRVGLINMQGDGTLGGLFLKNERIRLSFNEEAAGWNWIMYNHGKTMQAGSSVRITADLFVKWKESG